jgi:hypothetical protein
MQKRNLEQRCAIKFCVKLNEKATESYKNLKWAYGENTVSKARVFRWDNAFWMAVSLWKMNLVLEELARQKRKKI